MIYINKIILSYQEFHAHAHAHAHARTHLLPVTESIHSCTLPLAATATYMIFQNWIAQKKKGSGYAKILSKHLDLQRVN
jgi:hypothetical protein